MPSRRLFIPLLIAALLVVAPGAASAASGTIAGTVPQHAMRVVLMEAAPGTKAPVRLGSARSGPGGRFALHFSGAEVETVKYLLATRGTYRLALALGEGAVPRGRQVKLTERTTVAMGFAMAQFIGAGDRVSGTNPGLRNAAAMSYDLVGDEGGLSKVLREFPNGGSTSTLPTFNSLANLLTICRRQAVGCARLLAKARMPGGAPAADTLAAVVNIARYPWHDVRGLYKLSLGGHVRGHWQPSLGEGEAPDAWTLALL